MTETCFFLDSFRLKKLSASRLSAFFFGVVATAIFFFDLSNIHCKREQDFFSRKQLLQALLGFLTCFIIES